MADHEPDARQRVLSANAAIETDVTAGFPVFIRNEFGLWCPSCGETVADEEETCPCCGYPDDGEAMAHFHLGDDPERDDG